MVSSMRALLVVGSVLFTWVAAGTARGEDTTPPTPRGPAPDRGVVTLAPGADSVERLSASLRASAAEARSARLSILVTGATSGAVLVPAGVALWARADPVSHSIGVGMTIGGAAPLTFSALSLRRSALERLSERFEERRAAGGDARELMLSTLQAWSDAERAAHDQRIVSGFVELGIGAAAAAGGLGFLLARPLAGIGQGERQTIGSILVGAGVPVLAIGIRSLVQPSIAETSWARYRAATGLPGGAVAAPWLFEAASVELVPRGALFAATLRR